MGQRSTMTEGRREATSVPRFTMQSRRRSLRARRLRRGALALILVAPAGLAYLIFVIRPIAMTVQYSFYKWDGVTASTWVGLSNYLAIFHTPELSGSIVNAFELIIFFSLFPVALGLFGECDPWLRHEPACRGRPYRAVPAPDHSPCRRGHHVELATVDQWAGQPGAAARGARRGHARMAR